VVGIGKLAGQVIDDLLEQKLREVGAQEEEEHPVGEVALANHRRYFLFVQLARLCPV